MTSFDFEHAQDFSAWLAETVANSAAGVPLHWLTYPASISELADDLVAAYCGPLIEYAAERGARRGETRRLVLLFQNDLRTRLEHVFDQTSTCLPNDFH